MNIEDSIERIKTWFLANEGEAIVENLNPGATSEQLGAVREQGFRLTDEMQRLYALHDGQSNWERNLFLPNVGFLSLAVAMQSTDRLLRDLFGCPDGCRTATDALEGHGFYHADDEALFLEEEWTPAWFCFGETESEALLQNAHSGRVLSWSYKDSCAVVGTSLGDVLSRFAKDLETGTLHLSGDASLPGVADGFTNRCRYIRWSY